MQPRQMLYNINQSQMNLKIRLKKHTKHVQGPKRVIALKSFRPPAWGKGHRASPFGVFSLIKTPSHVALIAQVKALIYKPCPFGPADPAVCSVNTQDPRRIT